MSIRAIDGGGEGFRRADIYGTEIKNFKKIAGPVTQLAELLKFAGEDLAADIHGIAYSMAGVIGNHDVVVMSPNAHFLDGVLLARETEIATGIKTALFNDMEAAVTGMAALLTKPKSEYFMGITWSSGIGLRICKNGNILSTAEGGHMTIDPSPFAPLCGCGKRGHAEAIFGGHALRRRVIDETQTHGISLPHGIDPCAHLDECYKNGERWAVTLYQMVALGMGIFLANIQTVLRLPLIVWKGTVAINALPLLENHIRTNMQRFLIDPVWAEKLALAFEFSPDLYHDSLIGAASCYEKYANPGTP